MVMRHCIYAHGLVAEFDRGWLLVYDTQSLLIYNVRLLSITTVIHRATAFARPYIHFRKLQLSAPCLHDIRELFQILPLVHLHYLTEVAD